MTCRELIEFLDRYTSGDLSEATRAAFEGHLDECPPCKHYLDSYRETIRLGRDACEVEDREVDRKLPEDLVRAILDAARRDRG